MEQVVVRRGDEVTLTVARTTTGRLFTNEDLVVHVRDGSSEADQLWASSLEDDVPDVPPAYLLDLTGTNLESSSPELIIGFGEVRFPVGDYWVEASSKTGGKRARVVRFPLRVEARVAVP